MPIKPENKPRYPKNWKSIRSQILDRSGNRCEGSPAYPHCNVENGKPHRITGSMVVLTIAHIDQVIENNDPSNLRALCQRCHLKHDLDWRRKERQNAKSL